MKKIILVSPYPPAQNPRLLKEYQTLMELGYNVKVLYGSRDQWANSFDSSNLDFILVGGKKGDFTYFYNRLCFKFFINLFYKVFSINAVSYFQYLIIRKLKADLYIAHNLSALPVAVKAAKYHKAKCGFDAEDFHRQEVTDDTLSKEYKLVKFIEDKYFPQVDYLTAASPLIAEEYKKLYPSLNPIVINNVFSSLTPISPLPLKGEHPHTALKLFWFSQTIGEGRGLENVISALQQLNHTDFELHLLGNVSTETKLYFLALAKGVKIYFYEPITPDDIFEFAAQFDIGLALEQNVPYNRDICLTNKIFTYINASLAVIASETQAQKQFLSTYPRIGKTYKIGDSVALATILKYYSENRNDLHAAKKASFDLAKNELNWEKESIKLTNLIKTII